MNRKESNLSTTERNDLAMIVKFCNELKTKCDFLLERGRIDNPDMRHALFVLSDRLKASAAQLEQIK